MNKLLVLPQPLHPKPFYDESLSGFLLRFSLINRIPPRFLYGKLEKFMEKQISNYCIDREILNDRDLKFIANISNNKIEDISNMRITENKIHGNLISYDDLETVKAKVCPYCLSDIEYIRKIWLLSIVTACPHHKVQLIDCCSICSKDISWRRGNLFICTCGHRHKKSQAPIAATSTVKFSEFIYSKCNLYKDNLILSNNSYFIDCDLLTLNSMLHYLGRELTTGLSVENKYKRGNISFSEYVQFQLDVIQILKNWPEGYRDFLSNLHLITDLTLDTLENSLYKFQRLQRGNLKPLIEEFHLYMKPIEEKKALEEIQSYRRALASFKVVEKQLSLKRKAQGFLGLKEVVKLLGCQEWHIRFWIDKGFMKKCGDNKYYNEVTLESFQKFKRTYITLKDIQKKLKTSYSQLLRKGMIPVSGLKIDGGRMYLYRKKDIKLLLK
ncbi:TniQ family protein [Paenibacillus typhae]|uniref:TniQ protein n=1 Tax=Paenibacillus typhae TaxID=1174501 RepID=A0A1G8F684_9BACL|nr:TniQ family protein [Paenibacillus typhae]SDH77640.1 TniQ protein [Paenibacillus typhae]